MSMLNRNSAKNHSEENFYHVHTTINFAVTVDFSSETF